MLKGKKRLLIAGCALIAVAVMLTLYAVLIGFGVINIHENTLVIRAGTAEKAYDGEPLVCEEWTLVHGELKNGHTLIPLFSGSQTAPGQSANHVSVRIVDANEVDVTGEYRIECLDGTLSVYNPQLKIVTRNLSKEYDGTALLPPAEGWTLESGVLMEGHTLHVTMTGSQTAVGSSENSFTAAITDGSGKDVTGNYVIEFVCGTLKVLPRAVTVKSASAKWKYDGTPLTAHSAQVAEGTLVYGHELRCEFTGSQTEIGVSENFFTVDIVDGNGASVISNYDVTSMVGVLWVVEFIDPNLPDDENPFLTPETNSSINGSGNLSDEDVLALQTNVAGPVYLRLQHFGNYNTETFGWDQSPPLTEGLCEVNPLQWVGSALLGQGEAPGSMSITWLTQSRGMLIPYFCGEAIPTGVDDSYVPLGTWDYTVSYVPYNVLQTLTGKTSSVTLPAELAAQEAAYRDYVHENYLQISNPELQAVIWRHIKGHISPASRTLIQDVATYIRGVASYNLEAALPRDGVDPIIFFLEESKEGVCRHFASAAVMMYRALGIPARYVTGYSTTAPENQLTYVTAMQAHAWVEVYIDGLGWIPVEVTGGSGSVGGTGNQGGSDGLGQGQPDNRIPLKVRPVAVYGVANGTEYRAKEYRLVGELASNHEFTCTFGGSLSVPGEAVSYIESYSITDKETGEDVAYLYAVETLEGTIRVVDKSQNPEDLKKEEPVWLVIKPVDVTIPYRGETITATEWEYVANSPFLKDGHRLVCEFAGELSEPGTAESSILSHKVYDAEDNDVSDQYEVDYHAGYLKILPPDLYLVIKPKDVVTVADGQEWMASDWEYTADSPDSLVDGHTLVAVYAGSRSDYGESVSSIIGYTILDEQGTDVTAYYNVVTMPGRIVLQRPLIIKPQDVFKVADGQEWMAFEWEYAPATPTVLAEGHTLLCNYEGALSTYGETASSISHYIILDEEGNDASIYYSVETAPGRIVLQCPLIIKPKDVFAPNDGQEKSASEWEYAPNSPAFLMEGHTLVCNYEGSLSSYGETASTIVGYTITDGNGNDVAEYYSVETLPGRIVVQRYVSVKPKDVQAMFDGELHGPMDSDDWEYVTGSDTLEENHVMVDCVYSGAVIFPIWPEGNYSTESAYFDATKQSTSLIGYRILDTETGEDVTHLYAVDCQNGYVAIRGLEFEVIPENCYFRYDGAIHEATEYRLNPVSYVNGSKEWFNNYAVEVTLSGERQDYGFADITVENVVVRNADGEDVTRAFDIGTKTATMQIYLRQLAFETASATKVYDGAELRMEGYRLLMDDVLENHTLSVETPSITGAGKISNKPVVTVTDENGEDVTMYYYLDMENSVIGTLTVEKLRVIVTAGSETRAYDPDTPLTCGRYSVEIDGVVREVAEGETCEVIPGEIITVTISGEQLLPGECENSLSWEDVHIHRDGIETTENYEIEGRSGVLNVFVP